MLYGHIENEEDRADHLLRLRALQDETGGFDAFVPLAFHPDNTPLDHIPVTTGFDDLKSVAVSRLLLDNISHIKAYWVMMTPRLAQIALRFGADVSLRGFSMARLSRLSAR
jgi:aminodeoxyfutalosine synthase